MSAEFVEPGATATDDQRPEFQKMIERACDDDHPFDVVLVYSFNRFFRDGFGMEMYIRKLAKVGVRLVSITQELGDDPSQVMMRQIIGLFDEYQSRENGKHVRKAMIENAQQGFYNGSPVALGYKAVEVEKRGIRIKKKLAIDPVEAETVRLIFRLYLQGDGTSGPLGVKKVVNWLNERGYRTRLGARFGVATIHGILTNAVYIGESVFNKRDSRTLKQKPVKEHIATEVPAIISKADFEAVAANLKLRNPRMTAPRVVTGPILLTGVAVCGGCDGAMTLRTGTSSTGKIHKYYTCSICARQGKTACKASFNSHGQVGYARHRKSDRETVPTGASQRHPREIDRPPLRQSFRNRAAGLCLAGRIRDCGRQTKAALHHGRKWPDRAGRYPEGQDSDP